MAFEASQEEINQEIIIEQQKELLKKMDALLQQIAKQKMPEINFSGIIESNKGISNALSSIKPSTVDISGLQELLKSNGLMMERLLQIIAASSIKPDYEFDVLYDGRKVEKIIAKKIKQ